jgi:hypothetical protein
MKYLQSPLYPTDNREIILYAVMKKLHNHDNIGPSWKVRVDASISRQALLHSPKIGFTHCQLSILTSLICHGIFSVTNLKLIFS